MNIWRRKCKNIEFDSKNSIISHLKRTIYFKKLKISIVKVSLIVLSLNLYKNERFFHVDFNNRECYFAFLSINFVFVVSFIVKILNWICNRFHRFHSCSRIFIMFFIMTSSLCNRRFVIATSFRFYCDRFSLLLSFFRFYFDRVF